MMVLFDAFVEQYSHAGDSPIKLSKRTKGHKCHVIKCMTAKYMNMPA